MSTEQRDNLDAILRQSAFPADAAATLGGVPIAEITTAQRRSPTERAQRTGSNGRVLTD